MSPPKRGLGLEVVTDLRRCCGGWYFKPCSVNFSRPVLELTLPSGKKQPFGRHASIPLPSWKHRDWQWVQSFKLRRSEQIIARGFNPGYRWNKLFSAEEGEGFGVRDRLEAVSRRAHFKRFFLLLLACPKSNQKDQAEKNQRRSQPWAGKTQGLMTGNFNG